MENNQNPEREIEIIRDGRQEELQNMIMSARSTRFTDESFSDYEVMKYEKSNDFALAYYNMSPNAQKLMVAGLTCVYNVNKIIPFTEEEKLNGFWVAAPITHIAKLMGLNVEDKKNKSFYRTVRNASSQVVGATVTKEDKRYQSFDTFSVINRIMYNPLNDGRVYFHFAGGTSQYYLDNAGGFTVYSLILNNHAEKIGKNGVIRLIEVLKTNLYKAQRSPQGKVTVYYDYVDLRCKLSMIDTNDDRVIKILNNKNYTLYEHNEAVAYERVLAVEKLDKGLENIEDGRALKSTQYNDYKNFKRILLDPSQKTFAQCIKDCPELMDMMFEYTPRKYRDRVIGIFFTIYTVEAYKQKELEQGVQLSLFDIIETPAEKIESRIKISEIEETSVLEKVSGDIEKKALERATKKKNKEGIGITLAKLEQYFKSRSELKYELSVTDYYTLAQKANADVIIEKYELMEDDNGVRDPLKWLLAAIKNDYKPGHKNDNQSGSSKNMFNQFQQNKYDFDALEEELLANQQIK